MIGETGIVDEVEPPGLQDHVVAPVAVKETKSPLQMVGEFTVTIGIGLTVTFAVAVFEHPNAVPVTI